MKQRLNEKQSRLVEENLALVQQVLQKWNLRRGCRMYEDCFGAGCLGLCRAAVHFESAGPAFLRCARRSIAREVRRTLAVQEREEGVLPRPAANRAARDEGYADAEERLFACVLDGSLEALAGEKDAPVLRLLLHGSSPAEAAARLHVGLSTVYRARRRACARLRVWMENGQAAPLAGGGKSPRSG